MSSLGMSGLPMIGCSGSGLPAVMGDGGMPGLMVGCASELPSMGGFGGASPRIMVRETESSAARQPTVTVPTLEYNLPSPVVTDVTSPVNQNYNYSYNQVRLLVTGARMRFFATSLNNLGQQADSIASMPPGPDRDSAIRFVNTMFEQIKCSIIENA